MTEENEQNSQEHQFGPGALLKRTREEQGLSLNEVSSRLKLTLPVLKNIESDNYVDDLPITFYRGYIKNYAELLEIDESNITSNFQEFCQKNNLFKAPPPKLQGLQLDKPLNSSNWLFKVVTTVIILVLLFAIYYVLVEKELWKKFKPDSSGAQSTELQTNDSGVEQSGLLIGSNEEEGSLNTTPSDEMASSGQGLSEAQDNTTDSENSTLEIGESSGTSSLNQANDTSPLNEEETSSSATVSEAAVEQGAVQRPPQTTATQTSTAVSDGGVLNLSFTADCWVRVQDASGKVLALGIKSAGSSLRLSGQAPYSLSLGKASAVQLSYDGNTIDLSNYPDTRAAKLTLGE